MSLLNNNTTAAASNNDNAKKKSNSEYQKRQRERSIAAANHIKAYFEGKGGVPEELKEDISFLCREKQARQGAVNGPTIFEKMFGATPKVGQVVTAYDMLKSTNKNFTQMDKLIAEWAKTGNVVEFNKDKLEYTLKALKA